MTLDEDEREDFRIVALEDVAHVGTWKWDVIGDEVIWSDQMYRIFSVKPDSFEATFEGYLSCLHPDDRPTARTNVERALTEKLRYAADYRITAPEDEERWVHCRGRVVVDASGDVVCLLGTAQDITDRKRFEQHLAHQALHDPLTGLPNRSLLYDRLCHAMQRTLRTQRHTGVFFVDLDRFKNVNDGAGHDAGDDVLRVVGTRLRTAMRQHDTVARYGGDEFVVVAEELKWPHEAVEVGARLVSAVTAPIPHEAGDILITASVGATVADAHTDAEAVLRDVDTAMYRAKDRGGNTVVWTGEL